MPALQVKFTQKAARDFRRKAAESTKSTSDLRSQIVIL